MDLEELKSVLKRQLLRDVALLYKRDDKTWKEPIVQTLRELQVEGVEAVFFGGTLRSLLTTRAFYSRLGRPRDLDIVVSGISLDMLKKRFELLISRETRFGGLQMCRRGWQFDIWPLYDTWAFVQDHVAEPTFTDLPSTTFFNLEAIAVEVWPQPGKPRRIFSGDDQFFEGVINKTIEINREENPFPHLCVVRALIMASFIDFKIGPKLAGYIAEHGQQITIEELTQVQLKHYGQVRINPDVLRKWICAISETQTKNTFLPIHLSLSGQLQLWEEPSDGQLAAQMISRILLNISTRRKTFSHSRRATRQQYENLCLAL